MYDLTFISIQKVFPHTVSMAFPGLQIGSLPMPICTLCLQPHVEGC